MTGGQRAMSSKPRQPARPLLSTLDPGVAVAARRARRHDRTRRCNLLNPMKKIRNSAISVRSAHGPCVWARFRRDSAGDSLEVVHDQRPPTPFHAQNRQFQPPTTTANDTWGVRALLRRLIPVVSPKPRITRWMPGVSALRHGEASLSSPLPWYPADRRAQWARTPTVGALLRRCGSRPGRA